MAGIRARAIPVGRDRYTLAAAVAAALLTAAALRICAGWDGVLASGDALGFLPIRAWWWRTWRLDGGWNPWIMGGFPTNADPQLAGQYYPPNALYALFDPWPATNAVVAFSYAAAALGAGLYVRRLGADAVATVSAGITYALCGLLPAHVHHMSFAAVGAWIPWTCLALEALRGAPLAAAAAVLTALLVLGGHSQATLYALALLAAFAVFGPARRTPTIYWGPLLAGAAGGLLVASLLLLPLLELTPRTLRESISFATFRSYSLPPAQLPMLLFPFSYGGADPDWFGDPIAYVGWWNIWELAAYPGAVGWAALALGGRRILSQRSGRFWLIAAAVSLALAVLPATALGRPLAEVPLLGAFRAQARALLVWSFAFAVFVGLGLTAPPAGERRARWRCVLALVSLAALTLVALRVLPVTDPRIVVGPALQGLLRRAILGSAAILAAALLAAAVWLAGRRSLAGLVVVVIALGDGFAYTRAFHPQIARHALELRPTLTELGRGPQPRRILSLNDQPVGGWRSGPLGDIALASLAPLAGVATVQGHTSLVLRRPSEVLGDLVGTGQIRDAALLSRAHVGLDLLGVRYVVVAEGDAPMQALADPTRWRQVLRRDGDVAYENLRVLPEAWLVTRTHRLPSAAILAAIRTGRLPDGAPFDPRSTALVEAGPDLSGVPPTAPPGEAQLERVSDDRLVVRTRSDAAALLVVGDVWYPGWEATVDGASEPVHPVDYVLRGVVVPAGVHEVVLRYRPTPVRNGALLAILGVGIVAGACVRWRRRTPIPAAP